MTRDVTWNLAKARMSAGRDLARTGPGSRSDSAGQTALAHRGLGGRARFLAAALPATGITLGLFALMNAMVTVKEIDLTARTARTLVAITPQLVERVAISNSYNLPDRLESAPKPPPPPKASATRAQIDLPQPKISGAAPEKLDLGRLQTIAVAPVVINERDVRPIRPPVLVFPPQMLKRGIEGVCEVRFDVNPRGRPYNIMADCSHAGFKRAAEQAVSKTEFAPKIVRGKPAMRHNVVYPLEFNIN